MSDTNVHRVVGNLLVGSSHFFVDTTNNKVGINTSSPSASLDIATGDLKVGSGITLASGGTITATAFDGDGSLLQNINSDSGSWVKDNVNSKIYVSNTDHRVAIGTTSASELLTVGNDGVNADVVNNIRLNGRKVNADGEICGLYFANSKDAGDGTTGSSASIRASRIGGSNFATQLDFYTNDGVAVGSGTSRLTILGSGNVGIGRASPQQNLHVHETGSGQVVIAVTNDTTGGGNNDGIHFGIDSSEQGFVWHKQNTALLFATNNTERMRVTNDGKLGIGTTSPSGVLHVVDSSANSGWNKLLIRPTTLWGDGVTTAAEDGGGPYRYMTMANIMLQAPHVCCSTAGQSAHIRIGRGGGVSTGEWWDLATRTDNKFQICKSAVATTGIVIDTVGRVGIGTDSPYAKLHVNGGSGAIAVGWRKYFRWNDPNYGGGDLAGQSSYGWGTHSIYASEAIITNNYFVSAQGAISSSDERIKKDIVDVEDGKALDIIRELKPKKYRYKDEINRGVEPVWGFIAQEVNDILPEAVKIDEECLPNIYEMANVSSNVITFTNFDTSTLESNASVLKVFDEDDNEHLLTIDKVIDEHSILVKEDRTESQLFIYGQRVNDFHRIRKETVWTVATAALQEVDRQLQTEKAELSKTKTDLQTTKSVLEADLQTTKSVLEADLQTTKEDLQTTRTELAEAKTDLQATRANVETINSKLRDENTLEATNAKLDHLTSQTTLLQNVVFSLTKRIQQLEQA